MKKSVAAIMILVISVSCAAAVVLLDSITDGPHEYSIEYVLNADADGNPNPTSYISGRTVELVPVTSDRYFGGWYLDEGLTELCMEITPGMSGNLKLYAKWQDSMEGRELKFRFSESVKDGYYQEYTIYGERTITYRSADPERGYYLNYSSSIKYDYGSKVYTSNDEFGQWNSSKIFDTAIVRSENVTTPAGEVECNVHVHTDGEYSNTIWVGKRDGVIYMCKETLDSIYPGKTFTYTLESQTVVPVKNSISVTAYSDAGITVEGSGEFRPDTFVELRASADSGSVFMGWYDSSMELVSEDPVLKVNTGWNDQLFLALNDRDPDFYTTTRTVTKMDLMTGTDDVSWKVVPYGLSETEFSGRSETAKCKFTEPGWYDVWIDSGSGEYHGYRSVYVGGLVDRDYTWSFDGREYRYSITFDYDDVLRYFVMADADERHGSLTSTNINHDLERRFVTWKDPYIKDMARDLKRMSSGMDDLQTAKFLLSFLQTIKYQSDKVFFAVEDYWKFPVETLYDRGGDCEDSAILYAALAKAMGYDSALVMFPTHMMAAIRIDGLHGDYEYFVDGERNRYYYIESTANFENFGKLPEGIDVKDEIPVFI